MKEVQRKYLEWLEFSDYEIEEVETELKNGEEPLVFESNQFYAWKSGYNKANEWHYVKDGDYPKENKKYWILTSNREPKVDSWLTISWVNSYDVIAWKEIVLPELKESE